MPGAGRDEQTEDGPASRVALVKDACGACGATDKCGRGRTLTLAHKATWAKQAGPPPADADSMCASGTNDLFEDGVGING